jgi:crAss001_48 related protein
MKPHQERVVTEKTDLDDKRQKLTAFIGGDIYRTLDATEQSRLNRQLDAMTLYSGILAERIAAFK